MVRAIVKPRFRVKAKRMDKFFDAVVERAHFVSKLSVFDCCYLFGLLRLK